MLNLLLCNFDFPDRQVKEQSTNVKAENMISRVDSDRFLVILLESITCYKKDDSAAKIANNHAITSKERKRSRIATQGWNLKVL